MLTFLTVVHISVCIFLAVIVLLQHGKGADIGATFGGGSQTVFGARGAATFLSKLTVSCAILFMITSLSLAYLSSRGASKSLFSDQKKSSDTTAASVPTSTPSVASSTPMSVMVKAVPVSTTPSAKETEKP